MTNLPLFKRFFGGYIFLKRYVLVVLSMTTAITYVHYAEFVHFFFRQSISKDCAVRGENVTLKPVG